VDPVDSRRGRKLSLPKFVCNECPSLQSLLRRTEISGGDLRVNPFAKLNYEASIRAKHWVVCLDQTTAMATKPVAKRHNPTISRFLSGKKRRRINWLGLTQFGVDQFHKTTDAPHHTSSHSHGIMTSTVRKHTLVQSIMSHWTLEWIYCAKQQRTLRTGGRKRSEADPSASVEE